MDNLLNSNLLSPLTTLIVGGFAIGLYIKQKIDQEKDAARLILQEIRYAEQQIRVARTISGGNYPLADKLLPTNSWHSNIHLFVGKLNEAEIDIISRFYSNAAYIDVVISKISDYKNSLMVQKSSSITNISNIQQQTASQPQETMSPITPQTVTPQPLVEINTTELYANEILKEVSQKIEFIYNTPAVDKLREIAEKRRFLIF